MKQTQPISALALAVLLSACASKPAPEASDKGLPGVTTQTKTMVSEQRDAATTMTVSSLTATVEAIDHAARIVTLVGPAGDPLIISVDEKVRNLDQVRVGDTVRVEFYEGLLAELLPPGSDKREASVTEALVRAAPGQRPAGGLGEAVSARVVIEFVDPVRHVVHFTGPKGKKRVVRVEKPEFRAMLRTLKPGDVVELTYFEAFAVKVEPAAK